MNTAERILLYLDADECAAPLQRSASGRGSTRTTTGARLARRPRVEPAVLPMRAADFGTVLGGQQSVAELQDILASWDYRMKQLAQAYADFSPTWVAKDQAAFTDWTNDWSQLQNRYAAAVAAANRAVLAAKLTIGVPNSAIPAQAEYDGLAKAMRQCYPPDGCPVAKGDFMDLTTRLSAAGANPDYSNIPQPKATDLEQSVYAASAPVDVVAQSTGLMKPSLPGTGPGGIFAWVAKHKTELLVVGGVLIGGLVLLEVMPLLALPTKIIRGVAAVAA